MSITDQDLILKGQRKEMIVASDVAGRITCDYDWKKVGEENKLPDRDLCSSLSELAFWMEFETDQCNQQKSQAFLQEMERNYRESLFSRQILQDPARVNPIPDPE